MGTKKNWLTILLIILLTLNIGALTVIFFCNKSAIVCNRPQTEKKHHRMAGEYLKTELNLTDAQSKQMDQLKVAHCDTLGHWVEKMREKRNFLTTEMMKSVPNDSLLNKTCDEIGDIYANIRKLNIQHYRNMKSICNDEQKKKLDTVYKGIFYCDDPMLDRFGKKHGSCGIQHNAKHEGCGMQEGAQHEGCGNHGQ